MQTLGTSCICKYLSFSKYFKWRLYSNEEYLWPKFQLNLTLSAGFISPKPPKIDQICSWTRKSSCFFRIKLRTPNTLKLKSGIQKVQMVLLQAMLEFLMTHWRRPMGQFSPNLASKIFFLFNFTRICWSFWDLGLTLFDIPKNVAFAEILFFSNIYFWFCSDKLGPNMDQNCKLWVRPLWIKMQNLEGFFKHRVCLIRDYLWSKFQHDRTILGRK